VLGVASTGAFHGTRDTLDTQSGRVGVLVVSAEVTNRSAQAQQYSSAGSQLPLPHAAQFLAQFDCENGGYLKLAIPLGNLMLRYA
jgi:hypothetical protein